MILYLIKGDVQHVDAKVGQQTFFSDTPACVFHTHLNQGIYLVLIMLFTVTHAHTSWSAVHRITILLAYIILHKQKHTVLYINISHIGQNCWLCYPV